MPKMEEISFAVSDAMEVRFMPRNPITICELRYMGNLVAYGISRCKPGNFVTRTNRMIIRTVGDTYDKVVGMRQALKSALANSPIAREKKDCKAVWDKFLEFYPPKIAERVQQNKKKVINAPKKSGRSRTRSLAKA